MTKAFSHEMKQRVVEKALKRPSGTTFDDIAKQFGVSRSSVDRWIRELRDDRRQGPSMTKKERRPQDWSNAEKLQAIIDCANRDDKSISAYCRQHGIYPHHINQWRQALIEGTSPQPATRDPSPLKQLKEENKQLKRDLQRKEKALAEAAALLVLKKKAGKYFSDDEDNA